MKNCVLSMMVLMTLSASLQASTNFLPTLLNQYPQVAGTPAGDCMTCHTIDKWQRNSFGLDLQKWLRENYEGDQQDPQLRVYSWQFISEGLLAIEELDSDGDGVNNLEELENGTFPGDELDY